MHNALTDSFLVANQTFGTDHLSPEECWTVRPGADLDALLGADPMPTTAAERPGGSKVIPGLLLARDGGCGGLLTDPPLEPGLKICYKLLMEAAVASPAGWGDTQATKHPGREGGEGRRRRLRWALGASPSWNLALVRMGARVFETVQHRASPGQSEVT